MRSLLRWTLAAVLLPAFFTAGLALGPKAAGAWRAAFPPPEYTTGDFSTLHTAANSRVVLYATATCPYCIRTRQLLDAAGVAYREYLIDESEQAQADFIRLGGRVVPLLFIGERRIAGYREQTIRDALAALNAQ